MDPKNAQEESSTLGKTTRDTISEQWPCLGSFWSVHIRFWVSCVRIYVLGSMVGGVKQDPDNNEPGCNKS